MTTLEPEQKDILEKLNEIALEANWGTVDRVYTNEAPNGIPKAVAVIQEAMMEIRHLRKALIDIGNLYDCGGSRIKEETVYCKILEKYGITLDEKNS